MKWDQAKLGLVRTDLVVEELMCGGWCPWGELVFGYGADLVCVMVLAVTCGGGVVSCALDCNVNIIVGRIWVAGCQVRPGKI